MRKTTGVRERQTRARSLAVSASLWCLAASAVLRVGWLDHDWPAAAAILVVTGCALPAVLWWLKRRDARALGGAPAGTLFIGGGNVVGSQLRGQPRLAEAVSAWRRGWMTGGYIGGTVAISADQLVFTPGPWSGHAVHPIEFPLTEVAEVAAVRLPAKVNVASLDVRLVDGTHLTIQIRGFDRLTAALSSLRAQRRLPDAVDVGR